MHQYLVSVNCLRYASNRQLIQTLLFADFATLSLTKEERKSLEEQCPYFQAQYLDYLQKYRFKPEQVKVNFIPVLDAGKGWGNVEIEVVGLWAEAIMWEVPLMACLSETYFRTDDVDWDYEGQAGS